MLSTNAQASANVTVQRRQKGGSCTEVPCPESVVFFGKELEIIGKVKTICSQSATCIYSVVQKLRVGQFQEKNCRKTPDSVALEACREALDSSSPKALFG